MKTKLIMLILIALGIASCENQDVDFPDFGTTAVYFPFQTPARSLILGKYDRGINENDNNSRFEIGVTMTGVYTNDEDRRVFFEVAPELLSDVQNVVALPESYYTIETSSPVTIPTGSINGRISVQLNDSFFDDPLSFAPRDSVNYVVPLLITRIENLDSLLTGAPDYGVTNPSRLNEDDWASLPKDYTLFGIKFINKYDAVYLRRGVDEVTTSENETIVSEYKAEFVEKDEVVKLTTSGRNSVELLNRVRRGEDASPGDVNIELVFDDEDNCTVRSLDEVYDVSGTGQFVENGDSWGNEPRDVIYLDYTYSDTDNNEIHNVKDTLVVRNRDVVFEEFQVQL